VKIKVQEWPDLAGEYTVTADGFVSLPLIGNIEAVGLRLEDLAQEISDQLRRRSEGAEQVLPAMEIAQYSFHDHGRRPKTRSISVSARPYSDRCNWYRGRAPRRMRATPLCILHLLVRQTLVTTRNRGARAVKARAPLFFYGSCHESPCRRKYGATVSRPSDRKRLWGISHRWDS
jgi:hypothetical protein